MASESRRIIKSHWKVTVARFSEQRQSQCISSITELELRLGEDTGNTWLKIISKVRAIFPYLRHYQNSQSESRKSERLQYVTDSLLLSARSSADKAGNPSRPPNCHSSGKQSQRGNPSTASGSHLHWVTPMEIPAKTFQPFLPEASPWDFASCRSKGGTGSNHTAWVESQSISNWKVPIRTTESNSLLLTGPLNTEPHD